MVPLRALVIEDDPGMKRLLVRLLERAGRSVLAVSCVSELPLALETGPFDEAFVDVGLPEGADGVQVSLALMRERPSLRLVVMSADADQIQRAAAAGLARRLPKPFTAAEFQAALSAGSRPQIDALQP